MKIVYKVVTKEYKSAITPYPSLEIQYSLGQWVYPKLQGSKIFCFKNVELATDYRQDYVFDGKVLVCEYLGNIVAASYAAILTERGILRYWGEKDFSQFSNWSVTPSGTVLVDAVKPIKEIE